MFLTKLKMAALVLVAVGTMTVGAVVLAQPPSTEGRPEQDAQKAASRLKFEIRTWKDGNPSGTPVVVEAPGDGPYKVETANAVIEIRPRRREDQPGREEDARRLDQQALLMSLEQLVVDMQTKRVKELSQLADRSKLQKAEVNLIRQIEELLKQAKETDTTSQPQPATKKEGPLNDFIGKVSDRRPQWATKKEYPLDQPVPKGIDRQQQPATKKTDQERRLEQLERKLDQILEALEGSKARKEMPVDPFHTEAGVKK
jgi:hypothetical protein